MKPRQVPTSVARETIAPALPHELWLHIDDYLRFLGLDNISRLSRTSRLNYERWTPRLYKNVSFGGSPSALLAFARLAKDHHQQSRSNRASLLFRAILNSRRQKWHSPITHSAIGVIVAACSQVKILWVDPYFDCPSVIQSYAISTECIFYPTYTPQAEIFLSQSRFTYQNTHFFMSDLLEFAYQQDSHITLASFPQLTHLAFGCHDLVDPSRVVAGLRVLLRFPLLQRLVVVIPCRDDYEGHDGLLSSHILRMLTRSVDDHRVFVVADRITERSDPDVTARRWRMLTESPNIIWDSGIQVAAQI
ncbi:hypothetical protein BKA62DRAFT_468401 [Auriculariales sp. MPI-PUGE-AT-0066]|nr:hypothetical protein BKA62DRAFT_468401 [Auriculariales sp. MPI-PUGE-AT-0066]